MEVKQYPVKYYRYAPVFAKQGSSAPYVWLHCEKLKGDNLLYTGVTRCEGSPFDGRLKITGLFQANKGPTVVNGKLDWSGSWVHGDEALRIKWSACPKSIVFQQIVFGNVPTHVYNKAMQAVPATAAWTATMAKLKKMQVFRASVSGVVSSSGAGSSSFASSSSGTGLSSGAGSSSIVLDAQQRLAVEIIKSRRYKGVILVGGAGSGKSRVLTHTLGGV